MPTSDGCAICHTSAAFGGAWTGTTGAAGPPPPPPQPASNIATIHPHKFFVTGRSRAGLQAGDDTFKL
jgi:hypothetical protein